MLKAESSKLFVDDMLAIRGAVEHFLNTGICWIEAGYVDRKPRSISELANAGSLRKFIRMIAKEKGRPFIFVENRVCHPTTPLTLTVPKRQNLKAVVSGLLLGAHRVPYVNRRTPDVPLLLVEQRTNWVFMFKGDEGQELLQHWMRNVQEDPVMRIALKLPPR